MKQLLACAFLLTSGLALASADQTGGVRLTAAEIASAPVGEAGPGTSGVSGIRTRVLSGNPTQAGLYTIALLVPANTRIAAHHHKDERSAIVISGDWYFGYGTVANDAAAKLIGPGGFYTEPAGLPHFARTGAKPAVVYITGTGPTDTQYVVESAQPN
jgi:uncharacterized RmlC-like cupin family protein